jgi:hypothetical protein
MIPTNCPDCGRSTVDGIASLSSVVIFRCYSCRVTFTTPTSEEETVTDSPDFTTDEVVLVATAPDGLGETTARVVAVDGDEITVRFFGLGPVPAGLVRPMHRSDVRRPKTETVVSHRDGLVAFDGGLS